MMASEPQPPSWQGVYQPKPPYQHRQPMQARWEGVGVGAYRRTSLQMIPPNRRPIIHRIKRRHLINPHRRHLQPPRHLVHDAQAREAVLPLPEVEQGHDGGFLVLRRVAFEDFGDEFFAEVVEFEGD